MPPVVSPYVQAKPMYAPSMIMVAAAHLVTPLWSATFAIHSPAMTTDTVAYKP